MSIVDRRLAGEFIKAAGTRVDVARWAWQEADVPPPESVLDEVRCDQDARGAFAASWEPGRPSVDGTCERLAVLEDLGRIQTRTASRALDYLADRVGADGRVDEVHTPEDVALAWATPDDTQGGLARTALAGYWLAIDQRPEAHAAALPGQGARGLLTRDACGSSRRTPTRWGRWSPRPSPSTCSA